MIEGLKRDDAWSAGVVVSNGERRRSASQENDSHESIADIKTSPEATTP